MVDLEGEVAKGRHHETKAKRGGKALRRIKTFLRREKKYVVVEGGSSSQRSRTRSVLKLWFQIFWSLISNSGKTFQSQPQQRSSASMDCGRWKIVEKDSRTRYQPDAIYRGSQKTVSSSNSRENSWTCHCCRSSLPSFMCSSTPLFASIFWPSSSNFGHFQELWYKQILNTP